MKEKSMSMANHQEREKRLERIKNKVNSDGMVQVFENSEFGKVRTIEKNNEVWFVAKDICDILGYSNSTKALIDHCKNTSITQTNDSLGRQIDMKIIPERDVYRLIMRSKLSTAEKFEEWVVGEVLPTLRKTGGYVVKDRAIDFVNNWLPSLDDLSRKAIASVLEENRRLIIENSKQKEEIVQQKNTIHELTSVVDSVVLRKTFTDYVKKVVNNNDIGYDEAYNRIYELVGRMLKKDLKLSYKKYKISERELVDKNKAENKERNLKGDDRLTPYMYKNSNCNISMVEYIIDVLKEPQALIESIASVCEVGVAEVLDTYQLFRDDKIVELEY